jgi:hypothetical protein
MKRARDPMGAADGKAMLDQLPELYFAVLKNTQIEQQIGTGVRCSFELPIVGKRTKTAPTARDAIRAVLIELSELLTQTPTSEWPADWHTLVLSVSSTMRKTSQKEREKAERFQSKVRQFTIGVTMPTELKLSLQNIADEQDMSFAEVSRQLTGIGFDDFDERSFSEGSEELLGGFLSEIDEWQPSEREQVMVRLEPNLAIRLRSAAKEYRRSASEFGALCLAHGFVLQTQLAIVEQKIAAVRGSRVRGLAPKVGLGTHAALLSGILAGSIAAPKKVVKGLQSFFETPEFVLRAFFKRSFDSRAAPAFKAENGKPQIPRSARDWKEAVKTLKLPPDETKQLLGLDE